MGTAEPLREEEGVRPSIIVYCLEDGCKLTTWHGLNDWAHDEERSQMVADGAPSMMAPYCPNHRQAKTAAAA